MDRVLPQLNILLFPYRYCVCKIQISCIRQINWFSHEELDETHPNVFTMDETSVGKK